METALLLAALAALPACNGSGSLGPPSHPDYDPMLDPADFGGQIDNPSSRSFRVRPSTSRVNLTASPGATTSR